MAKGEKPRLLKKHSRWPVWNVCMNCGDLVHLVQLSQLMNGMWPLTSCSEWGTLGTVPLALVF